MKIPKTLHLTLKKKWFDMIASGEKKEEYREIKPYWDKRLKGKCYEYDFVIFRNGYAKNAPVIKCECKSISRCEGLEEWGAEKGKIYYVIELGEIVARGHMQTLSVS